MSIEQHTRELEIAKDPSHPAHSLPKVSTESSAVLDIGCGAGQALIALNFSPETLRVGIDIDSEALVLGRQWDDGLHLLRASANALPFSDQRFDTVFSRVAIPYTNVPVALSEIHRVMQPGGALWMSLHPYSMARKFFIAYLRRRDVKAAIHTIYASLNGLALATFGRVLQAPWSPGHYESFQTAAAMTRMLRKLGFDDIKTTRGRFFVVTAKRRR